MIVYRCGRICRKYPAIKWQHEFLPVWRKVYAENISEGFTAWISISVQEDTLKIIRHEVTVCISYSAQGKPAEHFPQKVAVAVISSSEQEGTGLLCTYAGNIPERTCFMTSYQCARREMLKKIFRKKPASWISTSVQEGTYTLEIPRKEGSGWDLSCFTSYMVKDPLPPPPASFDNIYSMG